MLDGSLKRGPASASWVLMSLVLLAGVSAPLAAFSATATPSASGPVHTPVATAPAAALQSAAAVGSSAERTDKPASAAAGKPLSPDDLVGMRAVGVTPDDVRKMRESGHADADDIIAAKATGVDPAYINAMRRVFPNADVGDLVGAKAVGIDPAYARDMRRYFPDVNLDDLTAMRAMGAVSYTHLGWVGAAGSIATRKAARARDRSHFGVPAGFDRFCPWRRRKVSKYIHIPSPFLLALSKIASNLDRGINGS